MNRVIPASELIINEDGTIFHLHLLPSDVPDNVILVGDPSRVAMVKSFFDSVNGEGSNREFVWCNGIYHGKEILVLSTGIGADNIDIVINELDALVNIDLKTREVKASLRKLNIIRIGTCGVVQNDIEAGSAIVSAITIGTDSAFNYYDRGSSILNDELSAKFIDHINWSSRLSTPYAVNVSNSMLAKFGSLGIKGITLTAPGFYAPQGRELRIPSINKSLIETLQTFTHSDYRILNIEMESAPITAMSRLMGHDAITICIAIAQRSNQSTTLNYYHLIHSLIKNTLDLI